MPKPTGHVLRKTGGRSKVNHLPLPGDDPRQHQTDISLAMRELYWSPSVA
jgi:UDP-glucuronate decarboxylase